VASFLAPGLVEKGHQVTVYNPHTHPYQEKIWNGVEIVHCYDPVRLGSASQFIYDLNCILDARRKQFDVWLLLGYTSSSIWGALYPRNTAIINNMDGLEWQRSKYNKPVKHFLRLAEKLAVRYSPFLVADSKAIQSYLYEQYGVTSSYIAYGAPEPRDIDAKWLSDFGVEPGKYSLVLARMEPENNIAMVLEGFCKTATNSKMLVIGNIDTKYGQYLVKRFGNNPDILFHEAMYEEVKLNALRRFCLLYFHGHSCGGTNPSLLEAMAAQAMIAAHENQFNRAVLETDAFYFGSAKDVAELLVANIPEEVSASMKANNSYKIQSHYSWPKIVADYETLILECCNAYIHEKPTVNWRYY
jgi:glycosyltransferase involved in cell wall biosynthesis